MKKTKRLVAVLLAVLLLASTLSVPASAKAFPDVYRGSNFLDAVNYVSDNRIIVGEDDGKFYPGNPVTRCQAIAILWRLEGRPPASNKNKFTDVRDDDYFAPAVTWGVNNGIVAGKTNTTFAPHESVSRQDAITFFYRYATKLSGHNPYGRTKSISGCSDYSQVYYYATEAMQWGLGSDLIQLSGNSLSPRRAMTRGEFAIAVTNYGTNVRRIVKEKDHFSFSNSDFSNFSDTAFMNDEHKAQFFAIAQNYMDNKTYSDFCSTWDITYVQKGICYGMAATTALDKLGRIAFNENYSSSSNMYSVSCAPRSDVESALTYYYFSQRITRSGSARGISLSMKTCMESKGPTMLTYGFSGTEAGHAILVNSCKRNGSSYEMEVYNPNSPGIKEATLTPIDDSKGYIKYDGYPQDNATIKNVVAIADFSVFDKMDIDGYQNSGSTLYSASLTTNEPDTASNHSPSPVTGSESDSIFLNITLNGPFHLENAEGEFLDYADWEISGTMDHWDVQFTVDNPSHLLLHVPISETLTYTPQRDKVRFSVSSSDQWSHIEGTGIPSVVVENGRISLEGDSMDFTLIHRSNDGSSPYVIDSSSPYVSLDAHAEKEVTITASATDFTVEGITGEYTLETRYSADDIISKEAGFAEAGEGISQAYSES